MKFKVNEIVFLAIMAALLLLCSAPVAPLVMTSTQLGIQALAMALMFSGVSTIAIRKVKKFGTLIILGIFSGFALLFMAPVMFFNQVISALLTESFAFLIFKSYQNPKAIGLSASLYSFFTIPTTAIFNIFMKGRSISAQIGFVPVMVGIVIGSIILGFIGYIIGTKISDSLEKAGKL